MISTITSTQVYKQISPIVRKNMTNLFMHIFRNCGDLGAIVEELSAIHAKKTLLQIYHEAVSEDYSFFYVNIMSKDKRKCSLRDFIDIEFLVKLFFIFIYIMTTLTNSEGNALTYTNGFIETILLQLNSSNNYCTSGDDDTLFIRIGSNKVFTLEYTYHINRNIFRIMQ